jgi:hypothetical protein
LVHLTTFHQLPTLFRVEWNDDLRMFKWKEAAESASEVQSQYLCGENEENHGSPQSEPGTSRIGWSVPTFALVSQELWSKLNGNGQQSDTKPSANWFATSGISISVDELCVSLCLYGMKLHSAMKKVQCRMAIPMPSRTNQLTDSVGQRPS